MEGAFAELMNDSWESSIGIFLLSNISYFMSSCLELRLIGLNLDDFSSTTGLGFCGDLVGVLGDKCEVSIGGIFFWIMDNLSDFLNLISGTGDLSFFFLLKNNLVAVLVILEN